MKKKNMHGLLAFLMAAVLMLSMSGFTILAEESEPASTASSEVEVAEATSDIEAQVVESDQTDSNTPSVNEDVESTADDDESASDDTQIDAEDSSEKSSADEVEKSSSDADEASQSSEGDSADESSSDDIVGTEDSTDDVETTYTYEDSAVKITATLSHASAVPDDAKLHVTPVTASSAAYNYDAYMEALNDSDANNEYNSDNTLLYDIGFYYDEVQEDGSVKTIEYEPTEGSVSVSVEFKQNQLTEDLGAEDADAVSVTHLTLDESVKDSVDTTADATDISASDINVQELASNVSVDNGESVEFATSSFSIYAFKTIKDNGNGTYDLTLSVTGTSSSSSSSSTTTSDVNVIFVLDKSASMSYYAASDTGAYVTWSSMTGNGTGTAYDYYTSGNSGGGGGGNQSTAYIRLYKYENGSYVAVEEGDTTPLSELYVRSGQNSNTFRLVSYYSGTPVRVTSSQTRWAATTSALSDVFDELAAKNTTANPDAVEMLLITFAGSASTGSWTTSAPSLNITQTSGTNWGAALQAALTAAQNKNDGDPTYIVFLTDGEPTQGTTNTSTLNTNYANALNSNYAGLYLVFTFGTTTQFNTLNEITHTASYNANSIQTLISALTSITSSITTTEAQVYTEVVYNDGITSLTSPLTNASGISGATYTSYRLVTGNSTDGYTYVDDGTAVSNTSNIKTLSNDGDTVYYDANTATAINNIPVSYNSTTKTVEWDLGSLRLVDGVLYTTTFTVYPSQEAYDLVAALNNGTRTWDSLTTDEASMVSRTQNADGTYSYTLNTNTSGTNIEYSTVKSTDTTTTGTLPTNVTESNGTYYYDGTAMTSATDDDGKTYYTLTETDTTAGTTTTYVLTIETDSSGTTYTLTETVVTKGGTYEVVNPDPVPLTSYKIKVQKTWVDQDGKTVTPNDDSVTLTMTQDGSTYTTVTLTKDGSWISDEISIAPGLITDGEILDTGHYYTFTEAASDTWTFSVGTYRPMLIDSNSSITLLQEVSSAPTDGTTYYTIDNKYYVVANVSDNTITATNTLKAGSVSFNKYESDGTTALTGATFRLYKEASLTTEVTSAQSVGEDGKVSFNNIPVGTYYMKETGAPSGYVVSDQVYEVVIGSNSTITPVTVASDGTVTKGESAVEKISNSLNTLTVKKVDQDSNALGGASFTLTSSNGNAASAESGVNSSDGSLTESTENTGTYTITGLADGTYYLSETDAPEGYTGLDEEDTTITVTVSDGAITATSNDTTNVSIDNDNFTITVKNTLITADVTIKKVDAASIPDNGQIDFDNITTLPGATFKLYKLNASNSQYELVTGYSGIDTDGSFTIGSITINDLPYGSYKLSEITAPSGYIIVNGDIYFAITSSSSAELTDSSGDEPDEVNAYIDSNGGIAIIVTNISGAALPRTGGPGTWIYTLGGLMLILAAALMYGFVLRRNNMGRRFN